MKKFYLILVIFFPTIADAAVFYQNDRYKIAGEGADILCKVLNNDNDCKKDVIGSFSDSSEEILDLIERKVLDLAILPSQSIHEKSKLKVLFYTSASNENLIVSKRDISGKDALNVWKRIKTAFQEKQWDKLPPETKRNIRISFRSNSLDNYFTFENKYPLHPAMAEYFLNMLKTPLTITYSYSECDRKRGSCTTTFDAPFKNYAASQLVGKMGSSILPWLVEALKSKDAGYVAKSTYAIGNIWPHDSTVVSGYLYPLLKHSDSEVQEQAIIALGKLEPVQPETIKLLKEISEKPSMVRKSFSDGSHGMSGFRTSIGQQPVSLIALQTLSKIDPENMISIFKKILISGDQQLEANAITTIRLFIFDQRRIALEKLPYEERRALKIEDMSFMAQQAFSLLNEHQHKVSESNRKLIIQILKNLGPDSISKENIIYVSRGLKDISHKCEENKYGEKRCKHPNMQESLNTLRGLGENIAIPEVIAGLSFIKRRGDPSDIEKANEIISSLAENGYVPNIIAKEIISREFTVNDKKYLTILGNIASGNSEFSNQAIEKFKQMILREGNSSLRGQAYIALSKVVTKKPEIADDLSSFLIERSDKEQSARVLTEILPSLGEMGQYSMKAIPLFIRLLNFQEKDINYEATAIKPITEDEAEIHYYYNDIGQTVFNVRWKAAEALGKMDKITSAALKAMQRSFVSEISLKITANEKLNSAQCSFGFYRNNSLHVLVSSYKKHSGDIRPLLKAVKTLLISNNPECKQTAERYIKKLEEKRVYTIEELKEQIKSDSSDHREIINRLRRLNTLEANDLEKEYETYLKEKYKKLNGEKTDIIKALREYYSLGTELAKPTKH